MNILALIISIILSPVAARYIHSHGTHPMMNTSFITRTSIALNITTISAHSPSAPNVSIAGTESTFKPGRLSRQSHEGLRLKIQRKKRGFCFPDCHLHSSRLMFLDSMSEFQEQLTLGEPSELEWHVHGCHHLITDHPGDIDLSPACDRYNFGLLNYHPGGRQDSRIRHRLDEQLWKDLQTAVCGVEEEDAKIIGETTPPELVDLDDDDDYDDDADEAEEGRRKKCLMVSWAYLAMLRKETIDLAEKELNADANRPDDVRQPRQHPYERLSKYKMSSKVWDLFGITQPDGVVDYWPSVDQGDFW